MQKKKTLNKVLLAGANGLIGTFLCSQLKDVVDLQSVSFSKIINIKKTTQMNLADLDEVMAYVESAPSFDALIFLVGLAHKKGIGQELDEFRRINKQTLVNLLSALDKENKLPPQIIFASTISVYGEKLHQNAYDEESEKHPFSPYAVTKLEAEHYLLENYADKSWILRFAPVYSSDFQLNINRRTKTAGRFYKVGNGEKKLSLCNLENIGSAVQGILEDKVPSGIYNISDAKDYSYNDLLKYVNAKWFIPIPRILVKGLYYIGKVMNNIFLKENAIKLISDNIFPSDKIRSFVDLPATLNDIKPGND